MGIHEQITVTLGYEIKHGVRLQVQARNTKSTKYEVDGTPGGRILTRGMNIDIFGSLFQIYVSPKL